MGSVKMVELGQAWDSCLSDNFSVGVIHELPLQLFRFTEAIRTGQYPVPTDKIPFFNQDLIDILSQKNLRGG
jgi:hypothetical protein